MNRRAILVEVVSGCVDKVLKKHSQNKTTDLADENIRIDIAMEVCDEVLSIVAKKGANNGSK
jgi:hypothetical protein